MRDKENGEEKEKRRKKEGLPKDFIGWVEGIVEAKEHCPVDDTFNSIETRIVVPPSCQIPWLRSSKCPIGCKLPGIHQQVASHPSQSPTNEVLLHPLDLDVDDDDQDDESCTSEKLWRSWGHNLR